MKTCPYCFGVLGRDCFNQRECGEITLSQYNFDRSDYPKLGGVSDLHIEKQEAIGSVLDDMQKHGISIKELIEARKIID
jgi:hypothetical protein